MSVEFVQPADVKTTVSIMDILECPYCDNKMNMKGVYFGGSEYKLVRCDNCQRQLKIEKVTRITYFGCPQK